MSFDARRALYHQDVLQQVVVFNALQGTSVNLDIGCYILML
jgi:hypothetical protein